MTQETQATGGQDTNEPTGQQGSTDASTTQTAATPESPPAAVEGQQPEGKTEGEAPKAEPEGAPEAYSDFAIPENMELGDGLVDDVKALAKELGLPQDKAQKIIDMSIERTAKFQEIFEQTRAQWVEDTKADPEIGGAKFDATLEASAKALDAFGSDALNDVLKGSGLGNHPEMIRVFAKIGAAISEDKLVTGKVVTSSDPAQKMFDKSNMN